MNEFAVNKVAEGTNNGEEITVEQMMSELQAAARPIRKAYLQKEQGKKQVMRKRRKNQRQARKVKRANRGK